MKLSDVLEKFSESVKDSFAQVSKSLKRVDERVKGVEVYIKDFEPYDDSELQEKVSSIKEYDDSELKEKLASLPEPYDDSGIKKSMSETIRLIPEPYDDSKMLEAVNKKIADFTDHLTITLEKVSKQVTYNIPTPVYFDGEPLEKGSFVLWQNSLWLNKMDDNQSVPSFKNFSYACLIEAPKEPEHKGLYQEGVDYDFNNIVMKDNASWIRVKGKDNTLPGAGWKLLAKGIKGRKGDKGESVKVEFEAEEALTDLNDRLMLLEAKNVKGNE